MRYIQVGLDLYSKRPVQYRYRGDVHFFAHDDSPGPLIDHNFGGPIGLYQQAFELTEKLDGLLLVVYRCVHRDQRGIFGVSRLHLVRAKFQVDGAGDARGCREISLPKLELYMVHRSHGRRQLFDNRTVGDPASGGIVDDLTSAAFTRDESAGDHRSLCRSVDLPIRAFQWRQHQDASLQISGIANRRYGDVDASSRLSEGRQVCQHQHCCRVSNQDRGG